MLAIGAKEKGLHLIGTGDITQPDWLGHVKKHLTDDDGILNHEGVSFIPTVEIEDTESIHHIVILPDYQAVDTLRRNLSPHSPNMNDEWGGRPRVNLDGEQLAGHVRDVRGMIGPAHAFTPYRSIFRENKHTSLKSCYGDETSHIHFIELGLSADSETADCIPELRKLTYVTASDAHSPAPNKLGREFVRFEMGTPTYEELFLAMTRTKGRKPVLNIGFNPRLGKYYLSFCSHCRRTLVISSGDDRPAFDDLNIYISCSSDGQKARLLDDIHNRKVMCPADGKKIRLGVRDRAAAIGDGSSRSPSHRPPYLHIAPLLDIISLSLNVKSTNAKSVRNMYDHLRGRFGPETVILTETPLVDLRIVNERISEMIGRYRDKTIGYIDGGGGRYGTLIPPWEDIKS
jgi:PHP family Zn ribbon phosphoesterase